MYPRLLFLFLLCTTLAQAQPLDLSDFKNLNIRNIGPANMSGRITAIDAVEQNPNIIYLGAASGGVWKSENGGSAWRPVFDDQPTQNIGAVAIQQSNPSVIWVGTGEGNPRNSMNLGMGVFKSLDGGRTWTHLGLEATKTIHRIIIDPTDPDVVYAGAMGDPWTPNEDRGLFKTTDGGLTWKKILYTNDRSGIADLVMDPANPNKLLAAVYDHRRTPYSFVSGGPGSGLFITYDGGRSWKQLTEADGLPPGELGRIGLAIAPSDPGRIYAKIEATQNALYRSDNGGVTWYKINDNPRFTNNRPYLFKTEDYGKTWRRLADENNVQGYTLSVIQDFKEPNLVFLGTENGLWISIDEGENWVQFRQFTETDWASLVEQVQQAGLYIERDEG